MTARNPAAMPIRFGVVCHDSGLQEWQARCISALLAVEGVELDVVVLAPSPQAPTSTFRRPAGRLLQRLGRSKASRVAGTAVDIDGAATVDLRQGPGGVSARRATNVVQTRNIHFILDFVHPPGVDRLAAATQYGLWRYRIGAALVDAPAGWEEIVQARPITRVILEAIAGPAAEPVLLHEGYFRTVTDSFRRNRNRALLGVIHFPARLARELMDGNSRAISSGSRVVPRKALPATWKSVLRLVATLIANRLRRNLRSLLRHEVWNVGLVDAPISEFLKGDPVRSARWLPALPRSTFVADPFPLGSPSASDFLAEAFDYRTGRGVISVVTHGEDLPEPRITPCEFEVSVHASYPCTFQAEGDLYCVPELHQLRTVRLYRLVSPPNHWAHAGTIVDGVAAVDPTVFRHEGHWWLFFTDQDVEPEASLWAWYAPALDGPWLPHAANPIKTDVRSSRPAGTPFVHEGTLYRPAQDNSQQYGGAISLNAVTRLTPLEFHEQVVTTVRPDPAGPYPHGLHTLSNAGNVTLVDGRRMRFIPRALTAKLRARLPWP